MYILYILYRSLFKKFIKGKQIPIIERGNFEGKVIKVFVGSKDRKSIAFRDCDFDLSLFSKQVDVSREAH